ncbi:MAG: glycosyltransferase family 4 protein, partial [Isosphaeraceae bacterium]|nr:glycosyltransferase family 4 protein [Isosphaeraceae bacterium]
LAGQGFAVEVLSSTALDLAIEVNPVAWCAERGWSVEELSGHSWSLGACGIQAEAPPHLRVIAHGVPVTLYCGPTTRHHAPDEVECRDFLRLFDTIMDRFRPDVVLGYGGDWLQGQVFARARRRGATTVFNLHNCRYTSASPFADIDAVRVPSRFAAEFYRRSLGLECTILPNPVQRDRIQVQRHEPKYLTFINPTVEKGVYVFARIADELGRRRPDLPLLVVEARGPERDVAACGLDLRGYSNVFFMSHTPDPRRCYRISRAVLMPSLVPETFGRVAAEAMCNGIPVLASDRGALPETLGEAGLVLPLPKRLTPTTRLLPTAEEVAPWIEAIIRFWDDAEFYEDHGRRARQEAKRWEPEALGPQYVRFLQGLRSGAKPSAMEPLIEPR